MFTAYLYKSLNLENACKKFLEENFKELFAEGVLETLNCTEFVKNYLLSKDYLDGEIITDEEQIVILIHRFIESLDINSVRSKLNSPI